MKDFKFFQSNHPDIETEWWQEDDVIIAMDSLNNVRENNVLYERIQFLEDNLVTIRNENTQLNIEMDRLRRLRNNL
jgi:regulator of replication initiation timing